MIIESFQYRSDRLEKAPYTHQTISGTNEIVLSRIKFLLQQILNQIFDSRLKRSMLSINKNMFLSIAYQRLFSSSSILSGYSLKISSMPSYSNSKRHCTSSASTHHRVNSSKTNNQANTTRHLFQPIDVKPMVVTDKFNSMSSKLSIENIGQELTGGKTLERSMRNINMKKKSFVDLFSDALLRIITEFYRRDEIKKLAADQGLNFRLFQDAYVSFRKFCIQSTVLPVDLHIILNDIISESGIEFSVFFLLSLI